MKGPPCPVKGAKRVEWRSVGRSIERGCLGPDGQQTGTWVGWYRRGIKRYERMYVNGKIHGVAREWKENEQLSLEAEFEHGTLHGPFVSYGWFGSVTARGRYQHGKPVGPWKRWNAFGILILDYRFGTGILQRIIYDGLDVMYDFINWIVSVGGLW